LVTCASQVAAGEDQVVYFIQRQTTSPYAERVIAQRSGVTLWMKPFTSTCNNLPYISNLTLGYDGNLYMDVYSATGCSTVQPQLVGLNANTGAVRFATQLPSSQSASAQGLWTNDIMPYSFGIAVVNNGPTVYYYDYSGTLDSSKTFSPSNLGTDAKPEGATITVGGDDAEFSDFAEECVIGTRDSASAQYQTTMEIIGDPLLLQASLESLFEQVRSAAPNAVIDVVGYPDVVAPGGNCPTYLSSDEQIAVETVVTGLNNDLRTAVSDSGSGFQFIDPTMTGSPFDGHDLCSADSYFNGLSIPQTQYSFHPNAAGQAAYAELIANNM